MAVDQFGHAALLESLGVGKYLPLEGVSPETLRAALLDLTGSPGVAARCAELRDEVRSVVGAAGAADLIESLV